MSRAHLRRGPSRLGAPLRWLAVACIGWLSFVAGLMWWTTIPIAVGWQPAMVLSASMAPALRTGDVVLLDPVEHPEALPSGRVVTVSDPARPGGTFLHRLIRHTPDGALVTRGDANATEDYPAVSAARVQGEVRMVVPFLGQPVLAARAGNPFPAAAIALMTWLALTATLAGIGHRPAGRGRASQRRNAVRRASRRGPRHRSGSSPRRLRRPSTAAVLCVLMGVAATGPRMTSTSAPFSAVTTDAANGFTLSYFAFNAATIATWAGTGVGGYSGDGGAATAARLSQPSQAVLDAAGDLYLADINNNRIRKITAAGTITTVAGTGTASYGGDGGPATSAAISGPRGVAIDPSGTLYIADSANNRIRKVTPGGTITTVAGTGVAGYSGDGGAATSAQLNLPRGLTLDGSGNLYVVDSSNFRVRRITPGGIISTVAGTGTSGYSGDGGAATSAKISQSYDIALDGSGCLYLADTNNHRIRHFCVGATISTVAGTGAAGYGGDGGPATGAVLNGPSGVAVDAAGVLYIADWLNNRLRKVTPAGNITTLAGTGAATSTGDGGAATLATVNGPRSVATAASHLYVIEQNGERIRRLTG